MTQKNIKLIGISIAAVIVFLTGCVLFFCIQSYERLGQIDEMKSKLSGYSNNLHAQIDSLKSENKQLQNSLSSKQSDFSALSRKTNEQSDLIANLKKPQTVFGKVAYLTFDDGPSSNTLKILPILKKHDVRATFFVTGQKHPEYMKNIVADGNQIGSHCFYHGYASLYKDEISYFNDLHKINNLIKKQIGFEPKIIRFPGGSSNLMSRQFNKGIMSRLTKAVTEKNYVYFDWNCDSGDASASNVPASSIINNIKRNSAGKNQITILMHDSDAKGTTVQALEGIILYLRSQGYRFEVLTYSTPAYHQKISN